MPLSSPISQIGDIYSLLSLLFLKILECFLSLRVDSCQRVGVVQDGDGDIKFSSYFVCTKRRRYGDYLCP